MAWNADRCKIVFDIGTAGIKCSHKQHRWYQSFARDRTKKLLLKIKIKKHNGPLPNPVDQKCSMTNTTTVFIFYQLAKLKILAFGGCLVERQNSWDWALYSDESAVKLSLSVESS